ncbi:hypothetical protein APHAL10511_004079 [Amanita phalloides]|nr:hypothetical protein APHAL10511_004079 [Amanita phalloides]
MSTEEEAAWRTPTPVFITPTSTVNSDGIPATEKHGTGNGAADTAFKVSLNETEDPQHLASWRKWCAVIVISFAALCITAASSMASFTEKSIEREFHVSSTVSILAISFVSDMFSPTMVANPLAVYTFCAFVGPILGPLISGFINQNLYWRWTYYILLIWEFIIVIVLIVLVPETYVPLLVRRKVTRLQRETGDTRYWSEHDKHDTGLFKPILMSVYIPFRHLVMDRMALLLDLWTAFLLGILYLATQAYPFVFGGLHHFSTQLTGLTFVGIGIGTFLAFVTQPLWNRHFARQVEKYGGIPPPEVHLVMAQVGAVLVPTSLFCLAFTTYRHVHYIAPIIASVPFGAGIYFVFKSVFTYLVTAYRPIAASALAANSTLRTSFAAGFPLFAHPMYARLGAVGATALLAGLATLMTPLPFIFAKIGPRLRAKARFAA